MVDGLVVVDKPAGWTSHDVVAKLRGVYRQKRIGHAGTLDPDATGVLLVGLGRATRLMRFLQDAGKAYRGRVVFGVATSTLDASGMVVERADMTLTDAQVREATARFVGEIEQVPPMVSALKVGGRRLHELARAGVEVERMPRRITISRLDVESFTAGAQPEATVVVECSSGTYVRTLAADLGTALGGCAHLGDLRRLRVGSFTLEDAATLDQVVAEPDPAVLSLAEAMRDLEPVHVDAEGAQLVAHGRPLALDERASLGEGPFAVVGPDGDLLAVYDRRDHGLTPAVVVSAAG